VDRGSIYIVDSGQAAVSISGATPNVFPLDLVFFHFI